MNLTKCNEFFPPRQTTDEFQLFLEAAPHAVVATRLDGRITAVNTQMENLFGYSREELLGQKVEVLVPERFQLRHLKQWAGYLTDRTVRPMVSCFEMFGRRKDGTEFPIEVSLGSWETSEEMLVSSFIRDITERKRAEESISRLAAIVEGSDDAIIARSLGGTIMSWNAGAERLYGYNAEEIIGRPLSVLVPPEQLDEMTRIRKALRRGEHIQPYETVRLHKDGHPIEVSVTTSPIRNRAGAVVGASTIARDITERKRAEESISRLAAIVEGSDDAIVAVSLDGTVVSWNSGAERLFGYKAEDVIGRPEVLLIPPSRTDEMARIRKALFRGKRVQHFETALLHKDGHPIEVSVTTSPIRNRAGAVVGASTIARDISERKRAEESISRLAAIVEGSDDAIIAMSLDGTIMSWNSGAERLYGYKGEEILGRSVLMLVPPGRIDKIPRIRKALRRGLHIQSFETVRLHKDSHAIQVSVMTSPIKNGAGAVVGASTIARDISERKRAEESISRLAAIVEGSDDAIVAVSLDGTVVSWNSGAQRLFGYRAEEVIGRPAALLIPPGRIDEIARIRKAMTLGELIHHYETTRLHKDGHPIEISATISPFKNRAGAVIGASLIARDITERKQAEAALRLSEERFRVALKSAPVVVFTQDLQLRYTWINSPFLAWDRQDYVGKTDDEIVGGEDGARLTAIKQEVLRTGVGSRTEVSVTFEGAVHYFDLVVEPLRDATGTLLGVICSATDITSSKNLIANLQEALDQVNLLRGLLSICANCKRIRDDRQTWQPLESYIQAHSEAKFSHGVCPDCLRKLYPDYYSDEQRNSRDVRGRSM